MAPTASVPVTGGRQFRQIISRLVSRASASRSAASLSLRAFSDADSSVGAVDDAGRDAPEACSIGPTMISVFGRAVLGCRRGVVLSPGCTPVPSQAVGTPGTGA